MADPAGGAGAGRARARARARAQDEAVGRLLCCVERKNLPTLVDGVQVYNDGNPIPPGTQASSTCCCFHHPDAALTYSGIPEGTTRVPEAEEKEILQRWYGHWGLHNLGSAGAGGGSRFTDGYIDGNILALSGGMNTPDGWRQLSQKQRLSLWRGTDGTLYIDNTGSRVVSETPTELKIRNSIGFDMAYVRQGAPPAGVVVQGMAAPIAPVMERDDPAERLAAAKKMLDQGLISQSDFEAKKKEILTAV
jgi:hypothetical protein